MKKLSRPQEIITPTVTGVAEYAEFQLPNFFSSKNLIFNLK